MTQFLLKKIIILLVSLFMVATLTFALMQMIPGDPFTQEKAVPEEILKAMYRHYGLDQPWYVQYFRYMKGLVTFDLGPSFKYQGRTVSEIIREGFPVSLTLGLEALLLSIFTGIGLGCIASLKHAKWQDHFTMVLAVLGISVPSFILATFLQYFFAMKLDLLPVARWGTFDHSILPAIALAALPTAFIARLTRSNMVEIMQQDYIQTAQFEELVQFVKDHPLDNIGVFQFSLEKEAHAAKLEGQIPDEIKRKRYDKLMKTQMSVVRKLNQKYVGKTLDVMVEGHHPDSDFLMRGRFYGQCPEIDGHVIINDTRHVKEFGRLHQVVITDVIDYDLIGGSIAAKPKKRALPLALAHE